MSPHTAEAAAAVKHQVNKAVGEGVSHKRQLIDGSSPIYPLQLVASPKIFLTQPSIAKSHSSNWY